MLKKFFLIASLLWSIAYGQCDGVTVISVTGVTATTAQVNWGATTGATSYTVDVYNFNTNVLTYTGTTTGLFKVATGLTPGVKYKAFVTVFCIGPPPGSVSMAVTEPTFTTLANTTIYTPQKSTQFTYLKADTMFTLPRADTGINRAPNIGGHVVYRPQDSLLYYYNGLKWKPVAIDSFGVVSALNHKVDSVTVAGDSLFYWINGVSYGYLLPSVTSLAWGLSGNAGTTAGTNFLGTTDGVDLVIKTNSIEKARFINSTGKFNTSFDATIHGLTAGLGNGSVSDNTAFGLEGLNAITTGSANTAIGYQSMKATTTGFENTAVGWGTLTATTTGRDNTAFGAIAMYSNTTGINNTTFGKSSLGSNTSGFENTAMGQSAGFTITTGSKNTLLGSAANTSSATRINGTAVGANAYVGQDNSLILGSINGVNSATASTKVGIGTTTPDSTFTLVGGFKYDVISKGAGKVLTSDAAGGATWATPATSGTVTSVTGTTNRITSTGGATPQIDISAAYVGQTSITTLGTVATGTWRATTVAPDKGGTGLTTYTDGDLLVGVTGNTLSKLTVGTTGQVLGINGGGNIAWTTQDLPSIPTLQKVITQSGVLTENNVISNGTNSYTLISNDGDFTLRQMQQGANMTFSGKTNSNDDSLFTTYSTEDGVLTMHSDFPSQNFKSAISIAYDGISLTSAQYTGNKESDITMREDSITLNPYKGQLNIDSLRSTVSMTRMGVMVYDSIGGDVKKIPASLLGLGTGTVTQVTNTDGSGFDITISNTTTTPNISIKTNLTTGSVPVIGASGSLSEDNSNFFYNTSTHRLGLGTSSPDSILTVVGGIKFTTGAGSGKVLTSDAAGGATWQTATTVKTGNFSGVGTATTTFTVTFGGTQPNTSYQVNVTPTSLLGAAVYYVNNKTTTTFDVVYLTGLTGTLTLDYALFR